MCAQVRIFPRLSQSKCNSKKNSKNLCDYVQILAYKMSASIGYLWLLVYILSKCIHIYHMWFIQTISQNKSIVKKTTLYRSMRKLLFLYKKSNAVIKNVFISAPQFYINDTCKCLVAPKL